MAGLGTDGELGAVGAHAGLAPNPAPVAHLLATTALPPTMPLILSADYGEGLRTLLRLQTLFLLSFCHTHSYLFRQAPIDHLFAGLKSNGAVHTL
jgi:hypothetical protein